MVLVQVLHTMVLLVEECLRDLRLALEIANHHKEEDTPTRDHHPSTHMQMAMIKAMALIGRTRVSVISTIHIMINKNHNLPDLKCQISMLLQ